MYNQPKRKCRSDASKAKINTLCLQQRYKIIDW